MLHFGADMRFGSFDQIIQSALLRVWQYSAFSWPRGNAEADPPSWHLFLLLNPLIASIGISHGLLAVQQLSCSKLPLTTWFFAFYLIGQAKTGIPSLELSRHLSVKYYFAWLRHNRILRAMTEREEAYVLRGKIQMDDADLGS